MAAKEPINDTTLEVLQTVDLWNTAMIHVLTETLIKSGVIDADTLIERFSAVGAKLRDRSRLPPAADYIERRVLSLSEDIRVWEQQLREGE